MKSPFRLVCFSIWASLVTAVCGAADERRPDQAESIIGPEYSDAPEAKQQDGVPKGKIEEFMMDSKDSPIYKGIAKDKKGSVPYQRKVAVYIPHDHRPSKEMPLMVVQDGIGYCDLTSRVLDNLIEQKRIPAMVAIFINSGGGDSLGSQRGLEYDTVDDTYSKFIESEVIPRISKEYQIKFTTDGKVTRQTLPAALEWLWQGYFVK